jgi:rhodanese-related sulfurtransferase
MIYRFVAYSLILLGIGGTIYLGVEGIYGDQYEIPSMDVESFSRQLDDSARYIIIDVRTIDEIEAVNAPWENTIQIPLLSLEERCIELTEYKDTPLMLICPTGNRSKQGARILQLAGFDAYYLKNGIQELNG